jgi:hypothetical protein
MCSALGRILVGELFGIIKGEEFMRIGARAWNSEHIAFLLCPAQ